MQEKSSTLEPLSPNLELFNAISDETRLKMLMILSHSEFTVNELKEILDIHQSNASRHLSKLSNCKLLKDRREGIKAFYGLSDDLYLSHKLYDMISKAWENLPDRALVESRVEDLLLERRNTYSPKFHKLSEAGGSLKAQISLFSHLMVPFEHAIDIGCGEGGDLSFMLANRCKRVTAIDISETTVNGVKKIAREFCGFGFNESSFTSRIKPARSSRRSDSVAFSRGNSRPVGSRRTPRRRTPRISRTLVARI